MSIIFTIFDTLFVNPIINLMVVIIKALEITGVPGALGLSIILLTLLIKLITWPAARAQILSMKSNAEKMAAMKPKLEELKKTHKEDKMALAQAQSALYKEHGLNPAVGCLPTLIQIPVFLALYNVLLALFDPNGLEKINSALYTQSLHLDKLPSTEFLGVNLAVAPTQFQQFGYGLLLLPFLSALLQFVLSKMLMPIPVKAYKSDTPKETKEKESTDEAIMNMQSQLIYLTPLIFGFFAFSLPAGLSVYWITYSVLGILQQYMLAGWGGMADIINRIFKTNIKPNEHPIEIKSTNPKVKVEYLSPAKVETKAIKSSKSSKAKKR